MEAVKFFDFLNWKTTKEKWLEKMFMMIYLNCARFPLIIYCVILKIGMWKSWHYTFEIFIYRFFIWKDMNRKSIIHRSVNQHVYQWTQTARMIWRKDYMKLIIWKCIVPTPPPPINGIVSGHIFLQLPIWLIAPFSNKMLIVQ